MSHLFKFAAAFMFLLVGPAFAQITIYSTDMPLEIGSTLTSYQNVQPFNIGDYTSEIGGPKEWDFTLTDFPQEATIEIVDPGTAPETGQFPGATRSFHYMEGDTAEAWSFLEFDADQLTELGLVIDDATYGMLAEAYDKPTPTFPFPFTMGDSWVTTKSYSLDLDSVTSLEVVDSTNWNCDAYGTAIYESKHVECLRVVGTQKTVTTFVVSGVPVLPTTSTAQRCRFVAKGYRVLVDMTHNTADLFDSYNRSADAKFVGSASSVSEIDNWEPLPLTPSLNQNYPNPFNPNTSIEFTVPRSGVVTLRIYDVLGRRVATLVNRELRAGYYRATWDGVNQSGAPVASGIYFYQLQADGSVMSKKMSLVK
jgi:hypothetical protein